MTGKTYLLKSLTYLVLLIFCIIGIIGPLFLPQKHHQTIREILLSFSFGWIHSGRHFSPGSLKIYCCPESLDFATLHSRLQISLLKSTTVQSLCTGTHLNLLAKCSSLSLGLESASHLVILSSLSILSSIQWDSSELKSSSVTLSRCRTGTQGSTRTLGFFFCYLKKVILYQKQWLSNPDSTWLILISHMICWFTLWCHLTHSSHMAAHLWVILIL